MKTHKKAMSQLICNIAFLYIARDNEPNLSDTVRAQRLRNFFFAQPIHYFSGPN